MFAPKDLKCFKSNKTENAFSPTLPAMLFNRERNSKMLQKTNAVTI